MDALRKVQWRFRVQVLRARHRGRLAIGPWLAGAVLLIAGNLPAHAEEVVRLVRNTAVAELSDGTFRSNEVVTAVPFPVLPPHINYFVDETFQRLASSIAAGSSVFVEGGTAHCDLEPDVVETTTITITSALTGDEESFTAIETGVNTGIFRIPHPVPTRDASLHSVVLNDGKISTLRHDVLTAILHACGGATAETEILVEPEGVVFDSRTNAPLSGVTVTLIDAQTGSPVQYKTAEGSIAPVTTVTDVLGQFRFPLVPVGSYWIQVTPPPGYRSVSAVDPLELPDNRRINPQGSFGNPFSVSTGSTGIDFDYPLDPLGGETGESGFFVQKRVSQAEAEIGDVVTYEVQARNVSGFQLSGVELTDNLPRGFHYESKSFTIDSERAPDPVSSSGQLKISLGALPDGATVTMTYRTRVTPQAPLGDGINRVVGVSREGVRSNEAAVQVNIRQGVFTDRAIVFGKVFVDENGNGIQDLGERGVPGVRLFLEDGTYVISDRSGQYSLYGLSPRTHVMKLDSTTLFPDSEVIALDPRNALDGHSRFLDLKRGEVHKANFAVRVLSEKGREALEERYQTFAESGQKFGPLDVSELPRETRNVPDDTRHLPASGVVGGMNPELVVSENPGRAEVVKNPKNLAPNPMVELEERMEALNNTLGFIDLVDGQILGGQQLRVAVKGPIQAHLSLWVNGQEVSDRAIGKKLSDPARQLEAWEYIGVGLQPGENRLEVVMKDFFGNERGRAEVKVIAPGRLQKIVLELPDHDPVADGETSYPVIVRLQDGQGIPIVTPTELLLESDAGEWDVPDLNPNVPGTQIFLENGHGVFNLIPPSQSGSGKIRISSGAIEEVRTLAFVPDLRPMIAVGVVEGTINFSQMGRSSLFPASSRDGFEEELRSFAISGSDGSAAGRAAFFLKGKIRGDYLLTAAYDSEKDVRDRLFRDIEPDEYYPVYGDDGVRGFDAQSSGRLYVRIDKNRSYLLLGDFTTDGGAEAQALGKYYRSLNGVYHHFENDRIIANAWAANDTTRQVVEEIPANGTSGPYEFRRANGLLNSERVEILTRDRNQRSLVIRAEPMQRFTDYEFEPFTGRLLFKRPIPSLDRDLNPVSIRITYEVDQGGDAFWIYGADGQVKVHDRLEVGGSFVEDENPLESFSMQSVNSTVQVAPNTTVVGEYAQTVSPVAGSGSGQRLEVRHQTDRNEVRVFYGETDPEFFNSNSILAAGRVEMGLHWNHRLAPRDRINTQALWTEDLLSGGIRKGVRVDWAHTFLNGVNLEIGGRVSTETENPASPTMAGVTPNDIVSLRTRLTTPVPKVAGLRVYGEVENDVVETDKRLLAAGGEYELSAKTKAYARHEFINALGGPFELNTSQRTHQTVVGVETEYLKDAHLFNEYRAQDSFTGRESEAATGLRNKWLVRKGITLNTTFERITPFSEASDPQESTAATAGVDFHYNPDWRLATRVEGRTSDQSESFLHTLNYGLRISEDWTWLNRTLFYNVDNKGAQRDRLQARFQTGFAYRQVSVDTFSALMKYEVRFEDGNPDALFAEAKRVVHVFAADGHYQPNREWMFSAHYAGKYVDEDWGDSRDGYHAHLVSQRIIFNATERLDVGLNLNVFLDEDMSAVRYGIGPEIGYTLKQNIRIGAGYNFLGFYDPDFGDRNTAEGFYINLRMKFDENTFLRGKRDS